MSEIKCFRVNGFDPNVEKNSMEFYFKIVDDEDNILGSYAIRNDGIYYYRSGSHILTPQENKKTRKSWNGYISLKNLKDLFEGMIKRKIIDGSQKTEIECSGKGKVIQITRSKKNSE